MIRKQLPILLYCILSVLSSTSFGQAPTLGTAGNFVVFTAVGSFGNTGATRIAGTIGTNTGPLTGFPPGTITGQTHVANTTSAQAATDVDVAYNSLNGVTCGPVIGTTLGNGQVLTPNVYCLGAASSLLGNLTLDGQGNPNALFILKINGALSTAAGSTITLINGAACKNVYFQVNGAVVLETNSKFSGTILANGAISLLEAAVLEGRALSRGGAIALHNNTISATSLALTATAGIGADACNPATNRYGVSGTLTVTDSFTGTATVSDGTAFSTVSVNAGNTSVPYSLSGLTSATGSHTVIASYAGKTTSTTYNAPASCSTTVADKPMVSIQNSVSQSVARVGDVLTYTVVLTNSGTTSTSVSVRDSISTGTTYVPGSAVTSSGTLFTSGQPVSSWDVPAIGAGQSLTLTFQVRVDSAGIVYSVATAAGEMAKVCTSIPVKLCPGDSYSLTVPTGRAGYRWYRDGVLIQGQTTNVLMVTNPGSYSLGVDNPGGVCPDFSCCPFIVEADTLPVFGVLANRATCRGVTVQSNARIVLSGFRPGHTYQYSAGSAFSAAASLSGPPQFIPAGGVIASTLPNPATAQAYTIRVSNSSGCYTDTTVVLMPTVCNCPVAICTPFVLKQTKGVKRVAVR